jgi:demethylmenaquinone methyltransferase/2-methoxy-6-polyprenyl-1,4-benzoquinol methylase
VAPAGAVDERETVARELFAPLGPTYDRYANVLSFGQDPRWRRFLVSRIEADPESRVLDVATGTAAVAIELVRRHGCRVVGIDQSPQMLGAGRSRVERAGLASQIELREGRAEALPFEDGSFDALTFTYLFRYVDDPVATLSELARVVRTGGTVAGLEFGLPEHPFVRAAWEAYVGVGLPTAGRLISPGWAEVCDFLGDSVRDFWGTWPLERLLGAWRDAGVEDVESRSLTFGGGVVIWGRRS